VRYLQTTSRWNGSRLTDDVGVCTHDKPHLIIINNSSSSSTKSTQSADSNSIKNPQRMAEADKGTRSSVLTHSPCSACKHAVLSHYTMSHKTPPPLLFLNNSMKPADFYRFRYRLRPNRTIFIHSFLFIDQVDIRNLITMVNKQNNSRKIINLPTSPVNCCRTTLGIAIKSFSTIFNTAFDQKSITYIHT